MQNFAIPPEWIFVGLAFAAYFLPQILLRNEERISGERLKIDRPEVTWMMWVQPLLSLLVIVMIFLSVLGILPGPIAAIIEKNTLLVIAAILLSVEFINGVLAAISGVYALTRRGRLGTTRYINSERARLVGLLQMLIDGGLLVALFLYVN